MSGLADRTTVVIVYESSVDIYKLIKNIENKELFLQLFCMQQPYLWSGKTTVSDKAYPGDHVGFLCRLGNLYNKRT